MNLNIYFYILMGDWGLGIGDWGLGIGPNPQSPIPNPQIKNKKFSGIFCLNYNNIIIKNEYFLLEQI
jgi:hypothetical protein